MPIPAGAVPAGPVPISRWAGRPHPPARSGGTNRGKAASPAAASCGTTGRRRPPRFLRIKFLRHKLVQGHQRQRPFRRQRAYQHLFQIIASAQGRVGVHALQVPPAAVAGAVQAVLVRPGAQQIDLIEQIPHPIWFQKDLAVPQRLQRRVCGRAPRRRRRQEQRRFRVQVQRTDLFHQGMDAAFQHAVQYDDLRMQPAAQLFQQFPPAAQDGRGVDLAVGLRIQAHALPLHPNTADEHRHHVQPAGGRAFLPAFFSGGHPAPLQRIQHRAYTTPPQRSHRTSGTCSGATAFSYR